MGQASSGPAAGRIGSGYPDKPQDRSAEWPPTWFGSFASGRRDLGSNHDDLLADLAETRSAELTVGVGIRLDTVGGPTTRLERVWTAACDHPTDFSSLAKVAPMIAFSRIAGVTTVHLRGPETRATTMTCSASTEFFGAELRLGAFMRMFPPARLANLQDAVLPTLPDGRILLDNRAWEMPTPQNLDIFVERLERAGLLVFDPLVEELAYGGDGAVRGRSGVPERTAQFRFVRAVGLSRRSLWVIERARHAAQLLQAGRSIADVVRDAGYYDQAHLTRALRRFIGHTPAELARGGQFLGL